MSSPNKKSDTPFPVSFWVIPGTLLAGQYPRNEGEEDSKEKLRQLLTIGQVNHIIDLTESGEKNYVSVPLQPYDELLNRVSKELSWFCTVERMPIQDRNVPSQKEMNAILNAIDEHRSKGKRVYIHCWGGHGRTGTVIGCYLIRHKMVEKDAVFERIIELRQAITDPVRRDFPSPETDEQRDFVLNWAW
ncbi:protein-tyrosine phosphatase family protein [Heliorestis convoluta]|nr:dual specificity protein phosphatase family protein [Heliorestis convoluta]